MRRMKTNLLLMLFLGCSYCMTSQVVINEIASDGRVEILNLGTDTVDVADYWFCNLPSYDRLGDLSIICGSLDLAPGETVTLMTSDVGISGSGDELGFYTTSDDGFGAEAVDNLADYVIWGERAGSTRESVAVAAGIWTDGERAATFTDSTSLNYDGEGDAAEDYAVGDYTFCVSDMDTTGMDMDTTGMDMDTTGMDVDTTGMDMDTTGMDMDTTGMDMDTTGMDMDTTGMDMDTTGMDMDTTGMDVDTTGMDMDTTGMDMDTTGMDMDTTGMDMDTTGMDMDTTGMDMDTTGMDMDTTGMDMDSTGMDMDTTGMDMDTTGMDMDTTGMDMDTMGMDMDTTGMDMDTTGIGMDSCALEGADIVISLPDSSDATAVCIDMDLPVTISITSSADSGAISTWLMTDELLNILAVQDSNVFDINTGTPGVCQIWQVVHDSTFAGAVVDGNAADLSGCFVLSNPITVNKLTGSACAAIDCELMSSTITLEDSTLASICTDVDTTVEIISVLSDADSAVTSTWIVTDQASTIVALSASGEFVVDSLGEGTHVIMQIVHDTTLTGDTIGGDVGDLSGCFALSNAITIEIFSGDACPVPCEVDAGSISVQEGVAEIEICADDGLSDLFEVMIEGDSGANTVIVVTDTNDVITGFPESNFIDLEGTSEGITYIYNLAYENDASLPSLGGSINDLEGCYDLSNPIIVTKLIGEGCPFVCDLTAGKLEVTGGSIEEPICTDDGNDNIITVAQVGATGDDGYYVITDSAGSIIDISMDTSLNFEGYGSGTYFIQHLTSSDTVTGLIVGDNIGDLGECFELSNSIAVQAITGDECIPPCSTDGGEIMYVDDMNEGEFCNGDVRFTVAHISEADPELAYYYIVADEDGNIVEIRNSADGGDFDFSRMSDGVLHIWGWSTDGTITPELGDSIATLEEGCNVLSGNYVGVTITSGGMCDVGCHVPRDIRISPTGGNRYRVRWDRVNEAESYMMEVGFEGIPSSFVPVPVGRRKVTLSIPEGRIVVFRIKALCAGGEMSPYTIDFRIDNTGKSKRPKVGDRIEVSEIDIVEDGHVYPNPASEVLQLWYEANLEGGTMSIFSRDGQQVMTRALPSNVQFHSIDVSELTGGLYLLMVHEQGSLKVQEKFIKVD